MSRNRSTTKTTTHYVTLFNRDYASRGIALYRSLERNTEIFVLWVIALDDDTEDLLTTLGLQNLRVIPLPDIETPDLVRRKHERSFAEYCWTLTPFAFEAVFEHEPDADVVTYVDADVWFVASPKYLVETFVQSKADVLITEHAYHPAFDATATSGYFCVQFLSVKRDSSRDIIHLWKSQCLEWCFAYSDNGRFGDQGYLTEWPQTYGERVFIPLKKELFQGPWNALRFPYGEALAYHFHSFQYLGNGRYDVGLYPIPKPHRKNLYAPYALELARAEEIIRSVGFEPGGTVGTRGRLNAFAHRLVRFREIWTTH